MEASGHARWFERLLAELQFDLWIGDAAVIRPSECGSRRRIAGCAADSAIDGGRSLSADLVASGEEPGFAATAVAPAPHGAGAHRIMNHCKRGLNEGCAGKSGLCGKRTRAVGGSRYTWASRRHAIC